MYMLFIMILMITNSECLLLKCWSFFNKYFIKKSYNIFLKYEKSLNFKLGKHLLQNDD